jgi:hypothetical protein
MAVETPGDFCQDLARVGDLRGRHRGEAGDGTGGNHRSRAPGDDVI